MKREFYKQLKLILTSYFSSLCQWDIIRYNTWNRIEEINVYEDTFISQRLNWMWKPADFNACKWWKLRAHTKSKNAGNSSIEKHVMKKTETTAIKCWLNATDSDISVL